jgi:hypothetical protein
MKPRCKSVLASSRTPTAVGCHSHPVPLKADASGVPAGDHRENACFDKPPWGTGRPFGGFGSASAVLGTHGT